MTSDIAALVGSRICHDLISPIGAIGNGVELLTLTDGDNSAEVDLISQSVDNASARIRYFRVAYGAAAADHVLGRTEVLNILSAVARGGRLTYFWQVEEDQPRQEVRVAFLIMQCFETAMPIGGDIQVARNDGRWTLTAFSERLVVDPDLWEGLKTGEPRVNFKAAQVQFALLPEKLAAIDRELAVSISEDRITVQF